MLVMVLVTACGERTNSAVELTGAGSKPATPGLRHPDYPLTGPESELKPGVPVKKVDSRPAHLLESKSADK